MGLNMKCKACNHEYDDSGKFCPECGTPATVNESGDFIYLLSEDQIRRGTPDRVNPPYGSVAVAMVNGTVYKLFRQRSHSGFNKDNAFLDLFKEIKESMLGFFGQKEQKTQTYVMANLEGLPVVSIVRPISIPSFPDAQLRFELWVNTGGGVDGKADLTDKQKTNIGTFIQRFLQDKTSVKLHDFKGFASQAIEQVLASVDLKTFASDQNKPFEVISVLERMAGISGRCTFSRGKIGQRHQIDVSKASKPVFCGECGEKYLSPVKFCGSCGHNMNDASLWVDNANYLLSAEGEQVTLRLSMMIDRSDPNLQVNFDDEKASEFVLNILSSRFKSTPLAVMTRPDFLAEISLDLNAKLTKDWYGYITDFVVTDIRTAKEEWFFKTDALVAEALRSVEADARMLKVDDAKVDLAEAAFAITLRQVQQEDSAELRLRRQEIERRTNSLEVRSQEALLDLQEHQLEETTSLKKDRISDDIDAERADLERAKLLRDRETTKIVREDEMSDLSHDMQVDKEAAKHTIELNDMTLQAESRQRRQEISDELFRDEEEIRLEAKRKQELGHIEEDLEDRKNSRQIDKLKAMAELDASLAKQENEHELAKRDLMKNLDAAQMLAMQAAELAKTGGGASAADIVKAIAQSQADTAGAGIKDQMYREMLEIQRQASQTAIDAHKSAAEVVQSTNDKAMQHMADVSRVSASQATDGYKEAAKIAQTTNEKSMESMSKVATAAAGKKTTAKDDDAASTYSCASCNKENPISAKFCTGCGTPRPKE